MQEIVGSRIKASSRRQEQGRPRRIPGSAEFDMMYTHGIQSQCEADNFLTLPSSIRSSRSRGSWFNYGETYCLGQGRENFQAAPAATIPPWADEIAAKILHAAGRPRAESSA